MVADASTQWPEASHRFCPRSSMMEQLPGPEHVVTCGASRKFGRSPYVPGAIAGTLKVARAELTSPDQIAICAPVASKIETPLPLAVGFTSSPAGARVSVRA